MKWFMFRNVRLFCQMTGVFSRSSRPFLFALFINNKVHRRVFCGGHDVSELTDWNILLMHKPGFGLCRPARGPQHWTICHDLWLAVLVEASHEYLSFPPSAMRDYSLTQTSTTTFCDKQYYSLTFQVLRDRELAPNHCDKIVLLKSESSVRFIRLLQ